MSGKLQQPTMTGGELAPELAGRTDLARYLTSLKRCRNFIVRREGGVENRPGFYYCGREAAVPADHRLIPFVFSTEVSYTLFFGDGYIRFKSGGADVAPVAPAYAGGTTYGKDAYVTSAGVVYRSLQAANTGHAPAASPAWWVADAGLQISSLYTAAQVGLVRYTQSADVLYLFHPDVPPQELRRLSAQSFSLAPYQFRDGPFVDLNANEAIKVAASGVQGEVVITSSEDIFTANAVGSLFYIETKNLGKIKPWVVGERGITVGTLRRSDGKTYQAVTVPATATTWHEAGPRQPIHENGRQWDGPGDQRSNGVDTWTSGIEWEFVDTGFGVVKITSVADPRTATGLVTKRLPAEVVGGVGAPASTWTLSGTGAATTFAIPGAGYGVYSVTIGGVGQTPDENYNPGAPGGGDGNDDPYDPCPVVESYIGGFGDLSAAELVAGQSAIVLFDPVAWERDRGVVDYSATAWAPCWRIVTARGFEGECSDSAPIWTQARGYMKPPRLMGQLILTSTDDFDVEPEWDVVVDLLFLGMRPVQHVAVGNRNFWFGKRRGRYLLHHNRKPTP